MAMQSITSPKSLNHPQANQRQSINDALKSQMQSLQSNGAGTTGNVQTRFGYNSGNL